MKKDDKYRFSLQFRADSEEQIQAGELLEQLGNRKSQIVVAALNEYLAAHPDIQNGDCKVEVRFTSNYSRSDIEQMIRSMIEEKLTSSNISDNQEKVHHQQTDSSGYDEDIAQMLDNLDLFN